MKLMQGEYGNAKIGDTEFMRKTLHEASNLVSGAPGMLIKINMFSKDKWKQVSFADTNGFFVKSDNPDTDYVDQDYQWILSKDLFPGALLYRKWMDGYEKNGLQIKVNDDTTLIYLPDLVFTGEAIEVESSRWCLCGYIKFPIKKYGEEKKSMHLIFGSYSRKSNSYVVSYGDPSNTSVSLPCYAE